MLDAKYPNNIYFKLMLKHIIHPSFGKCELIPNLLAIHWKAKYTEKSAHSLLESYSLKPATQIPSYPEEKEDKKEKSKDIRDPRALHINQTETLTWATTENINQELLEKLNVDSKIEWASPVYRATSSEDSPHSWFTINPMTLLLPNGSEATLNEILSLDPAVTINETRSNILHGFTVLELPNRNAIELAEKLTTGTLIFENTPYISPLTHCSDSSCSTSSADCKCESQTDDCSPSLESLIPDDTFFPNQWGLERIKAPKAWPINQGDSNVVIAVLDQGVELMHPDLNLWPISYSTITHTNDGSPVGNHGTACAGIISSHINNTLGVAGLAGKCPVMAISTFFSDVQVAEGLY